MVAEKVATNSETAQSASVDKKRWQLNRLQRQPAATAQERLLVPVLGSVLCHYISF